MADSARATVSRDELVQPASSSWVSGRSIVTAPFRGSLARALAELEQSRRHARHRVGAGVLDARANKFRPAEAHHRSL